MSKYAKISIPIELVNEVDRFIKENPKLGFKSIAEFVKESIRKSLASQQPLEVST